MLLPAIPYFFGASATVGALPGTPYIGCSGKVAVFQVGWDEQPASASAAKHTAAKLFIVLVPFLCWSMGLPMTGNANVGGGSRWGKRNGTNAPGLRRGREIGDERRLKKKCEASR
jgi:hypothetical protein